MKIVINDTYGGFSLSPKGLEAYAKRKGIEKLYWFEIGFTSMHESTMTPIDRVPKKRAFPLCSAYEIPNPDNHTSSFSNRDIPRDDPDLVAVVEELGSEADGDYAILRVVEIPDDVEWQIEEYDGLEWVAEKHRTWH